MLKDSEANREHKSKRINELINENEWLKKRCDIMEKGAEIMNHAISNLQNEKTEIRRNHENHVLQLKSKITQIEAPLFEKIKNLSEGNKRLNEKLKFLYESLVKHDKSTPNHFRNCRYGNYKKEHDEIINKKPNVEPVTLKDNGNICNPITKDELNIPTVKEKAFDKLTAPALRIIGKYLDLFGYKHLHIEFTKKEIKLLKSLE